MNEYYEIEYLIYKDKEYDEAIKRIDASSHCAETRYQNLKAEAFFRKDDFGNAVKVYYELGDFYHVGYCYFLMNQVDIAIDFFNKAEDSPARNWSLFFAEIFRARVNISPTYLQVRAFLERDLNLFLRLNLVTYVQKIIDISDYLFEINPETNKYIARAFLFNHYPDYAKEYIDRAFEFTSKDAELYYLLAKYYKTQGQTDKVKDNLQKALSLSDNYVPAQLMMEEIS
ncbi:MAG: hypothetical protein K6A44_01010 [bacterium]|nr:hypothetical protein [bacterium]